MADVATAAVSDRGAETLEPSDSMPVVYAKLEAERVAAVKAFWFTAMKCLLASPLTMLPGALMVFLMIDHPSGTTFASLARSGRLWIEPFAPYALLGSVAWFFLGVFLLSRFFVRRGRQPGWDYIRSFKSAVLNHVCAVHFPGLSYDPKRYIGYDEFDATKLFAYTSDEYSSEDYFGGRIDKTDVCFAEVVAKRERRYFDDGRIKTYLDEFFHGFGVCCRFSQAFSQHHAPGAARRRTGQGQGTGDRRHGGSRVRGNLRHGQHASSRCSLHTQHQHGSTIRGSESPLLRHAGTIQE